ncbi:MAG: hypothetical protein L0211_11030 [Planctomycetaceae bacterium]|nr:hypothetical protein [Planctomycetaceae bacterium]
MQYQGLLTANRCASPSLLHQPGLLEKMGKLMDQAVRAGALSAADRQVRDWSGARVKLSGGQFTVTGATLVQRKEPAVSYGMFYVESLAEAIEWTKCFLQVIGEGECEIRPVGEPANFIAAAC